MKKINWLISIVTILMVFALLLGACAPSTPPPTTPTKPSTPATPPAPIKLNYNTMGGAQLRSCATALEFLASELKKRTEGRVEVTIMYGTPLAPPPGILDAVINGTADMADAMSTYYVGRLVASEIGELPIGCPTSIVASRALNDWYNKFKPKEWDVVKFLSVVSSPPAVVGTRAKAVKTLEDIKGQTLRVPGATVSNTLTALGAVPRSIPVGEIYENISKGVVEGAAMSIEAYPGFKLHEVIKYATDLGDKNSWGAFIFMAMNKDSWNKLQPKDQEILAKLATEAWEMRAKLMDEDVVTSKALFLKQPDREYITLAAGELAKLEQACKPILDTYISNVTTKGMPGADYVKYLQERRDYWKTQK